VEKFLEMRNMLGMHPEYPGNCNDFVFGHLQKTKIRDMLTQSVCNLFLLAILCLAPKKIYFLNVKLRWGGCVIGATAHHLVPVQLARLLTDVDT
jgi:hypothetical protein